MRVKNTRSTVKEPTLKPLLRGCRKGSFSPAVVVPAGVSVVIFLTFTAQMFKWKWKKDVYMVLLLTGNSTTYRATHGPHTLCIRLVFTCTPDRAWSQLSTHFCTHFFLIQGALQYTKLSPYTYVTFLNTLCSLSYVFTSPGLYNLDLGTQTHIQDCHQEICRQTSRSAQPATFLLMTHKRNKKHKMLNVSGNRK